MIRLSKRQIILLHDQLIEETGGMSGIRDDELLESAISAPFQSFGGEDIYPLLNCVRIYMSIRTERRHFICRRKIKMKLQSVLVRLNILHM